MSFNVKRYLSSEKKKRSLFSTIKIRWKAHLRKTARKRREWEETCGENVPNLIVSSGGFQMKLLNYKNILTVLLFLTLWVVLYFAYNVIIDNINNDRYKISSENGLVLLLDKKTGLVWRNVRSSGTKIPNGWEFMDYYGVVVPVGEQERRDNFKPAF